MKINVSVKPMSKNESVEKSADGKYIVRVNVPAKEGKANERAVDLIAKYFNVSKSRVMIVHGSTGREKIIDIDK